MFKRDGSIFLRSADPVFTAVLGGEVEVPTIDGRVSEGLPKHKAANYFDCAVKALVHSVTVR